ncbi:hypothetical protein P691DRAFT_782270 [Macrolepiota fuliginosa MF-IS2]|uniref:Uncharacterized protein n=1 Tax=Macrolepiota fuliginosa MF-IS2 TaxID=1400762 RepID=A0A9P5WZ99_9AGAR|nr:hypothetical protein P691DRAFT_782270 [Macrolepiota fuliginosa MF-IS2]
MYHSSLGPGQSHYNTFTVMAGHSGYAHWTATLYRSLAEDRKGKWKLALEVSLGFPLTQVNGYSRNLCYPSVAVPETGVCLELVRMVSGTPDGRKKMKLIKGKETHGCSEIVRDAGSAFHFTDELFHVQEIGRPIDHTALGDRVPFTLRSHLRGILSGKMTAFVATMSPERQEAFEIQMAQQQAALRLRVKRKARQMVNSPDGGLLLLKVNHGNGNKTGQSNTPQSATRNPDAYPPSPALHFGSDLWGSQSSSPDNPHYGLPISERLNRLLVRERRWEELDFDFDKIIDIPVVATSRRVNLSAGVFSMLYESGVLHQVRIPSGADQEVEWKEIHVAPFFITSGKRLLEQDLQVFIAAQPQTVYTNAAKPHTIHEVQVHLNQLSTGEPHPDAQRTISFKTREEFGRPWVGVECVGDNLLLVLSDDIEEHKPDDQVYAYDWKTGERKLVRYSSSFVECLDTFSAFFSLNERPTPVPYDDWGPPACRWFSGSADGHNIGSITGVFGQRYASLADKYDFGRLFLDEEYVLGIRASEHFPDMDGNWNRIKQLHVLHYG